MSKSRTIVDVRPAGTDHQVVTALGGHKGYRRTPCAPCPWKTQNNGLFPAEAFRQSARTAYDMADTVFACHESGVEAGHTCAGFLLRGAEDNLQVRLGYCSGRYRQDVTDGGAQLHDGYRAMAIANGVAPNDPVLGPCRN